MEVLKLSAAPLAKVLDSELGKMTVLAKEGKKGLLLAQKTGLELALALE